jgi:hypothetical protein
MLSRNYNWVQRDEVCLSMGRVVMLAKRDSMNVNYVETENLYLSVQGTSTIVHSRGSGSRAPWTRFQQPIVTMSIYDHRKQVPQPQHQTLTVALLIECRFCRDMSKC